MAGRPVGTIFCEVDMSFEPYTRAQKRLLKDATSTTLNIEKSYKDLGIKSAKEFDLMRAKISNAYNRITKDAKTSSADILRAEKAKNDQLNRLNEQQFGHQTSLIDNLKKNWLGLTVGITAVYMGISRLMRVGQDWARMAGEQQKAEAGLMQVMQSMGRYTPEFYNSMIMAAKGLQKVTTFGDEATIAGQKFLMSYREIPDKLMPRATAAMLDFAAMMKGDVAGAANALGKASMGMTGELRRIGITIDPVIAKSGDFAAILTEIEKQVGGQARAIAQTGIGPWEQLSNLWGDSKEKLGELVLQITNGMLPAIRDWAEGVGILAKAWGDFMAGPTSIDIFESQARQLESKIAVLEVEISRKKSFADTLIFGPDVGVGANTEKMLADLKIRLALVRQTIENEKKGVYAGQPQPSGKTLMSTGPSAAETKAAEEFFKLQKTNRVKDLQDQAKTIDLINKMNIKKWDDEAKGEAEIIRIRLKRNADELAGKATVIDKINKLNITRWEKEAKDRDDFFKLQRQNEIEQLKSHGEAIALINKHNIEQWEAKNKAAMESWVQLSERTSQAMEQNFSDLFFDAMTGKFKDLGDYAKAIFLSIQRAMADMLGQQATRALFGSSDGSAGLIGSVFSWFGGSESLGPLSAQGNVFNQGALVPFKSGGIIDRPTIFPMARGGTGLMGEAGPEAILPLKRTSSGDLGVKTEASGRSGTTFNIIINAVDAKSFSELTARNPQAIVGPFLGALRQGGYVRDALRGAL